MKKVKQLEKKVESGNLFLDLTKQLLDLALVPSSFIRAMGTLDKKNELNIFRGTNDTFNRIWAYSWTGLLELTRLGVYALIAKESLNYILN